VQQKLTTEHPNWKIPERRVNKFLKRHLNKHKNPSAADDDDTAMIEGRSSTPKTKSIKSFGKPFSKLFSRRSVEPRQAAAPEAPPEAAPPLAAPETQAEPEPEAVGVEAVVEQSRSIEDAYEDDNTGSEKEKCECNACVVS
jgi:hypothetical protein